MAHLTSNDGGLGRPFAQRLGPQRLVEILIDHDLQPLHGVSLHQSASVYVRLQASAVERGADGLVAGFDVTAWSGLDLMEPLSGGVRNVVLRARRGCEDVVVRRSGRSADALAWELDLLGHLDAHGIPLPAVVPADDGRRHVDGIVVQRWLPGGPPTTDEDWAAVLKLLRRVHAMTRGWRQRPGFASSRELLVQDRGGDVDLGRMPPAAVAEVRAAWQPVLTGPVCAIHGDVGGNNVLVHNGQAALLDWDEARVDVPWFDYAHLPRHVAVPSPVDRAVLTAAGVAWEAATCWLAEPEYAALRLAELREHM